MTNLQPQLNEQLDRIWGLIPKNDDIYRVIIDEFNYFGLPKDPNKINEWWHSKIKLMYKREILAAVFQAKDDQDEYILVEGSKQNPEYIAKLSLLRIELQDIGSNRLNFVYKDFPQTLRELYFANCFGRTQAEIENLKLIKW